MSSNDNNRHDNDNRHVPVVLGRTETTSVDTRRSFEPVTFHPPTHSRSGTLGAVYRAKCARVIEKETTIILDQVAKQSVSIRTITENFAAAQRVYAETAVFIDSSTPSGSTRIVTLRSRSIRSASTVISSRNSAHCRREQIKRALIDVEAEIDAAHIRADSCPRSRRTAVDSTRSRHAAHGAPERTRRGGPPALPRDSAAKRRLLARLHGASAVSARADVHLPYLPAVPAPDAPHAVTSRKHGTWPRPSRTA